MLCGGGVVYSLEFDVYVGYGIRLSCDVYSFLDVSWVLIAWLNA